MQPMSNPQIASADQMQAYNLWQLQEEEIGRDRRMALRRRSFFRPLPKGWWKRPSMWAAVFTVVFMTRDAFASLLVNLLVHGGN